MSLDIWPPVSPEELTIKVAETQVSQSSITLRSSHGRARKLFEKHSSRCGSEFEAKFNMLISFKRRELAWIVERTREICEELKHGLEDCYALLAPVDPGSTLVMSTPRNERVKGTITRVGTRIVKGTLGLQFKTVPPQVLTLSQSVSIHLHALDTVHTHLNESIDLLGLLLSNSEPSTPDAETPTVNNTAQSLSSGLRLLADSISSSIALLKGPPIDEPDTRWTTQSCPPGHFSPPLMPNFSIYITLQECSIVLILRALEPVDAPVHFGTKLGLAIGTYRRLEHDEADIVFKWKPGGDAFSDTKRVSANHTVEPPAASRKLSDSQLEEVYVREKVRVESADPSLISLYSKLGYLNIMLEQARCNLDAVMSVQLKTYTEES